MYKCVICDIDYPGYDLKTPKSRIGSKLESIQRYINKEKQSYIDIVYCWYCGLDMCYSCFGKCPCVSNKFKGPINKPWKLCDVHLGVKGDSILKNKEKIYNEQLSASVSTHCLNCMSIFKDNFNLYKTFECLNCRCNICSICYVVRIVICRYCNKKMCIGCENKCTCQKSSKDNNYVT
jgi:hypothetical protein